MSILLCGMFMLPVMAGSSQNLSDDGRYLVYVECTASVTRHTINGRNGATYPVGKGYYIRALSGKIQPEASVNGTSDSTYWSASHYKEYTYENIISARTVGYGVTVRAAN